MICFLSFSGSLSLSLTLSRSLMTQIRDERWVYERVHQRNRCCVACDSLARATLLRQIEEGRLRTEGSPAPSISQRGSWITAPIR